MMRISKLLLAICCTVSLIGCGGEKQADLFDHSKPVDLSSIRQAYDWYQCYDGEDKHSVLIAKIGPQLPDDEVYLIEDTLFVLRVPDYTDSEQPFLANAEDFYNSCVLSWNVWSNYEVYCRGRVAFLLCDGDEIERSIEAVSVDIIRDKEVRKAAQDLKDSLLVLIKNGIYDLEHDSYPMELIATYAAVVESKAYKFYDDEDVFVARLDSVMDIAEGMGMDKFQHYMDASEDDQVKVMLDELASCRDFDEQCSLWRNWANCEKSSSDDDWIEAVGRALMESGNYSPILNRVWVTWRAICQGLYFGSSRDSSIPNNYFNEYRKMCYVTCLKRVEGHPDDIYAMNCAAAIGGRVNMNRYGEYPLGNNAIVERFMMMPKRYSDGESSDEDEDEEEW